MVKLMKNEENSLRRSYRQTSVLTGPSRIKVTATINHAVFRFFLALKDSKRCALSHTLQVDRECKAILRYAQSSSREVNLV